MIVAVGAANWNKTGLDAEHFQQNVVFKVLMRCN